MHTLGDVRYAIDRNDEQAVALLGLRADYFREAAKCKSSESAVAAPERKAAMIELRRQWAQREGLDAAFVEKFYRNLIAYIIDRELSQWRSR